MTHIFPISQESGNVPLRVEYHATEVEAVRESLLRPRREDAIELLASLVAIDSVNPSLVEGGAGEGKIAAFVARWLADAGLEVRIEEPAPGRPNVIGVARGRRDGRGLMLNAHMDTVGIAGMRDPFIPVVDGDRLYGRGAYDMKGGLAAIMLAARAVHNSGGADGDLVVTAVMDEEYASLGTAAILAGETADGAVVTEPTGLRLCAAHKGFVWLSVVTTGRAAHGSRPELGVDAIAHMGRVLGALESLGREVASREPHPLLGTGSLHASVIAGGQELSSYPERCTLTIERRTVPGETPSAVEAEVRERLEALRQVDVQFDARCELLFSREPFEAALDGLVARTVLAAGTAVMGDTPPVYGDTPWMDAALLQAAGIPTVVFGPGGAGAHAAVEYASISEVVTCAEVLATAALRFCATG